MEPTSMLLLGIGTVASGIIKGIANYNEKSVAAETDRYRAPLAEENARRAEFVALDAEFKARNEGILDAGRFRMQATQSGLSGASKDIWVGQRYMDVYRDVTTARSTREQTVSRFLKEAGWHSQNADSSRSSALLTAAGTMLEVCAAAFGTQEQGGN